MLIASKREGDLLRALKWALTGSEMFIVSVDGRNATLAEVMSSLKPIFSTKDNIEAGYFTAKLFQDVEVLLDEEPFLQSQSENMLAAASGSNLANLVAKMRGDQAATIDNDDNDNDNESESQQSVQTEAEGKESKNQSRESEADNHLDLVEGDDENDSQCNGIE